MSTEIEIYIRFPLAQTTSVINVKRARPESDYIAALQHEIELTLGSELARGNIPARIIFGGCSSWTKSSNAVRGVFHSLRSLLPRESKNVPILCKMRPQDVTESVCKLLVRFGVNGIVLRVGSFHEAFLTERKASHRSEISHEALRCLKNFKDLFVALEFWHSGTVSREVFRADLEKVLYEGVDAVRFVEDLNASAGNSLFVEALSCAGYERVGRYFIRPQANHSILMKRGKRLLGLGTGAVSYKESVKGDSRADKKNPDSSEEYRKYIADLYKRFQQKPYRTKIAAYESFIYTSFMKHGELDLDALEEKFSVPLEKIHPGLIHILEHLGYIQLSGRTLRLTVEGRKLAANVISNFELREEDHKHFHTLS